MAQGPGCSVPDPCPRSPLSWVSVCTSVSFPLEPRQVDLCWGPASWLTFLSLPGGQGEGCSPFSHCRLCLVTLQTVRSSSWWGEPSFSPLDPPLPRSSHVTLPASPPHSPGDGAHDLKLSAALSRSLRAHCRWITPGASRNTCRSAFGM